MKRFLLFAVAVLAFVGCNNHFEDAQSARPVGNTLPTFTAGFEDVTRTYVEHNTYLRWHEGDRLTIFYGNTLNRQYEFDGKTGDNSGSFTHVPSGNIETGNSFDHIYAIYPYDAAISLADYDKQISLMLPAEQAYAEQSFGKDANTMVAVTESVEDTFLSFKNVCGYLKVKLYGDGWVKSIELKGNNGEKIAGAAIVTMAYGDAPKVAMANDATKSITLDCGEGVALSADAEKPTEFWFVVPPTTFKNGITITATDVYGSVFEQTTNNEVVVVRNEIQPMASIEAQFQEVAKPANNEIWYTATAKVEPYYDDEFGATLLSNTYNSTTQEGILTFDGDVIMIGEKAFYECKKLTTITIPDSVTTIGEEAFYICTSLKEFKGKFASDGGRCLIKDDTIISYANASGSEYVIPDDVTTIGKSAFGHCYNLKRITIPNSITIIGQAAFADCDNLSSVIIPDSVTTIEHDAFIDCDSLTSITIPDSVTTIGQGVCAYSPNLQSVTIGNSVTEIGWMAFGGCSNLKKVYCKPITPPNMTSAFSSSNNLKHIYVPTESVDAYKAASGWNDYADYIEGYDFAE